MVGKREIAVHLCQEGYSMSAVASMVNMSKAWVGKAIKRFRKTGSNKDRAKKWRSRNKRTAASIRKVDSKLLLPGVVILNELALVLVCCSHTSYLSSHKI
jgi:predicted transcriptional regulator